MREFINLVESVTRPSAEFIGLVPDRYDRQDLMDMVGGDAEQAYEKALEMKRAVALVSDKFKAFDLNENRAFAYVLMAKGDIPKALEIAERDYRSYMRDKEEERKIETLISAAPTLESKSKLTHDEACVLIAYDSELFEFIAQWVQNADVAEDDEELSARFLSILKKTQPVHRRLFRGQMPFNERTANKRGFHSWSENRATAEMFAERRGKVLEIDRPVQCVSLSDILMWRMRLTKENHYSGPQAEWLVVNQPEQYEESVR